MFGNSNTQHQLNSDHNDDEETNLIGQNSSLSHFISSSRTLDEDEEDEPLLLRQRNNQKQTIVNKNENNSNSSEEEESEQHQERLSDSDEEEQEEPSEEEEDDDDDDNEDDDEDEEDDDEDDDDDDDDFDDKKRSRTKSKRGFGQAKSKSKSKKQVKRSKNLTNNSSSTSTRKRQRTSSTTSYASASKKARRQQSSGSGTSSTSLNKRKIRRTAASNPINYHEESDDDEKNDQSRRKAKKQQRHLSSNSDSDDDQNGNTNNDDESNSNDYHSQTITDLELNTAKRQTKVRTSDNLSSSGEGTTLINDEPSSETIEKVLKVRFGRKDATGPSTTIYNVDEFGDPNANYNGDDEKQSDGEQQFLIKWKNWSHLHNTWESHSSLHQAHVKSSRILENFLKQHEQTRLWRRENLNMDEIELFECQQELNDTALSGYQSVERIIAHEKNREQENTYDYLCKWDGLQYCDCTWEDGNLISKRFQTKIDEYNARLTQQNEDLQLQQQQTNSGRKTKNMPRPRFAPITVQPLYLAPEETDFKLRDYQLEGLNWLAHSWCKENSVILADEMGLGKTIQTISFLSYVYEEHRVHGPFIIVVPLSTIQGWQQEFQRWAPYMNTVVYIGDMISREKIRHFEMYSSGNKKQLKFHALLTTYDFLLKDSKYLSSINWSVILVDEAHRLKNDDSMLYRTLIQFESQHRILITGTPLQNSLKELWSLLHFIMPNYFNDWNYFDSRYSSLLTTNDTSLVKRSSELHKELEPFLLRRIKRDVEKSLPAKVEQILRVEMTRLQKQYYKWILTRNYRALTNERGGSLPSFINIMMELKKCANHAFFVKRDDENNTTLDEIIKGSGKLLLLDKLLLKLRASNHRVLIFSQMVKMLNILAEYCKLRRFPFQRLDGSMKGEIRRQALNSFNRDGSDDFIFLLSTRAGGLGINLATADTVIIYDSDWNPQNDLQAQARAHRIGQTKQVNIYRLVAKQSVEETIIERAKQKMVLDHLVIQRMDTTGRNAFQNINNTSTTSSSSTTDNRPLTKEELNTIIKFGAEDLFKENSTNEEGSVEEESQKIDIDEILRRAETRQDDDSSIRNSSEDLLSQFKIANIQTMEDDIIEPTTIVNKNRSWKDIIPESERQKFDDECLAELTAALPPRSRKRVELFNSTSELDNNNNTNRHLLNEFTTNEIRRFVKSFKKFSDPIHRLDLITIDAELEDKSRQDIEELAKYIYNECLLAVEQHTNESSPTANSSSSPKDEQVNSREKIASIRLNNVTINAVQLINSIKDLESLKKLLTTNNEQRKTFSFPSSIKIKPVHWSCSWSLEDDKALLRGIYEYGHSNWEQIKMEPELGLSSKILLDDKQLKPQANHLQTRADYLLRLLKQYYENPINNKKKEVLKKKPSNTQITTTKKTKTTTEENTNGPNSLKRQRKTNGPIVNNHEKQPKSKEIIENSSGDEDMPTTKSNKKKSTEEKVHKATKKEEENASNDMFQQCKELLRPVKKWFSRLDAPEEAFDSHDDYTKEFEKCLLKIGDQIEYVLKTKTNNDYQTYRHHLWTFVSKFTTKLTDSQLKKYYRTFSKKRHEDNSSSSNQTQKSSYSQQTQHNQYSQSNNKNRQSEQDETYRKAGWGSSTQSSNNNNNNNNSTNSRNIKDSRLKHSSTMPLSKSSRSEQLNNTIGSTNTGTTSDYDRNRHHSSSGNNNRRSYNDSAGDSSSDYRSSYHRDRDSNSSRAPRRYDSMPSRYDQSSYNNRSSFQSNFSQPPPPFDDTRSSSSNRSSGNNKNTNRSSQNSGPPPPPLPPVPIAPPPPPPSVPGPELFQSIYLQYYDMYMQQATGLSSSQSSTTNSISPNSYAEMAAAYARQQTQSSASQSSKQ